MAAVSVYLSLERWNIIAISEADANFPGAIKEQNQGSEALARRGRVSRCNSPKLWRRVKILLTLRAALLGLVVFAGPRREEKANVSTPELRNLKSD